VERGVVVVFVGPFLIRNTSIGFGLGVRLGRQIDRWILLGRSVGLLEIVPKR